MDNPTIYLLMHEHELDGCDQLKILGVYSSRILAEKAQAYFVLQEGFCDYPDGFVIDEYRLNQNLWSEGFITV
jgi:hypothetical protein